MQLHSMARFQQHAPERMSQIQCPEVHLHINMPLRRTNKPCHEQQNVCMRC